MQDIALEERSQTQHRFVKLLSLTAEKLRSYDEDGDERYILPDDLRLLVCAESLVSAHKAAVDVDLEAAVYLVAAMRHIGERLVTRFGAGRFGDIAGSRIADVG